MSFLDFFRKNKQKTNTIASLHTSTSSDDSKDIKSENNVEHIDDNERKIAREKNNFYKAVFLIMILVSKVHHHFTKSLSEKDIIVHLRYRTYSSL